MVRLVTLTAKVPESYVKLLDSLVKEGMYTSRSDAVRAALRDFIRKHYNDPEVLKLQLRLNRQAAGGDGRG